MLHGHIVGMRQTFEWEKEFAVEQEAKLISFFQKEVWEGSQDIPRKPGWLQAYPNYVKYPETPRDGS